MKRYYVCVNSIPLRSQPENGYTELQAVERVQREIDYEVKFLGCDRKISNMLYDIVDTKTFKVREDLRSAY